MDSITLNDGTIIENAYVVPNLGRLFFYVQSGATMLSVCQLMSDPAKTSRITYKDKVYTGYVDLFTLQKTGEQISGGLAKMEE